MRIMGSGRARANSRMKIANHLKLGFLASSLFFAATENWAQWVPTNGPGGGRVRCITETQTHLFAGAVGGVFRSADRGTTWIPRNAGLPLEMDVLSLAASGGLLVVGTQNHGAYRSKDSGETWMPANTGLPEEYGIQALLFRDGIVLAGTRYGVFQSADSGGHWSPTDSMPPSTNVFSLAEVGGDVFAATSGFIYRSTDNGKTWQQSYQGLSNRFVERVGGYDSVVFASNTDGLFRSTDRGNTWAKVNGGLPPSLWLTFLAALPGVAFVTGPNLERLFRSVDGGLSWTEVDDALGMKKVCAMVLSGSQTFAGTWRGMFRSSDRGGSWTEINKGLASNAGIYKLAVDGNRMFAGTENGVYRTDDLGNTWVWASEGLPIESVVREFAFQGQAVFAGTGWHGIWKSQDAGATWKSASQGLQDTFLKSLAVLDGNIFAGMADSGVYRSSDQGESWSQVSLGLPIYADVHSLAAHGGNLFAALDSGKVYRSSNLGSSWEGVNTGLPGRADAAFLTVAGGDLFVALYNNSGNDDAVYRYSESSNSWMPAGSGVGTNLATDGVRLFAGSMTWGNGVSFSPDRGVTWEKLNHGLPEHLATGVLAVSGSNVFAATSSMFPTSAAGVWRLTLPSTNSARRQSGKSIPPFELLGGMVTAIHPGKRIGIVVRQRVQLEMWILDANGREEVKVFDSLLEPGVHDAVIAPFRLTGKTAFLRLVAGKSKLAYPVILGR